MKTIITGGTGFIGSNAAAHYLRKGHQVIVLDNFSRPESVENHRWLCEQPGAPDALSVKCCDIRDARMLEILLEDHADADQILHLAAQVAVTTSITNPREDFEVNALGTLNVLEAMRQAEMKAVLIHASTNKVYGNWTFKDVREDWTLEFRSPYGCSKGAADQYVLDYHRIFGLKTIVFRQSCIYGTRQTGSEAQGWIAWFIRASLSDQRITVYGNGKQVRDILYVDDLIDAYDRAFEQPRAIGNVYNIGGGKYNRLSVLELIEFIEVRQNRKLNVSFSDWRPADQRYFCSNIGRAKTDFGWEPRTSAASDGLDRTYDWIAENLKAGDRIASHPEPR